MWWFVGALCKGFGGGEGVFAEGNGEFLGGVFLCVVGVGDVVVVDLGLLNEK